MATMAMTPQPYMGAMALNATALPAAILLTQVVNLMGSVHRLTIPTGGNVNINFKGMVPLQGRWEEGQQRNPRFALRLSSGPTIPSATQEFHNIILNFEVRFGYENTGYISLNDLTTGQGWGQEEFVNENPFARGALFDLRMDLQPSKIDIYVNGRYLCDFRHRLPYNWITHAVAIMDVHIHSVTFAGL